MHIYYISLRKGKLYISEADKTRIAEPRNAKVSNSNNWVLSRKTIPARSYVVQTGDRI